MSTNSAKPQHSTTHSSTSTLADLQEQVSALTRELAEAREQQISTLEVLRVISDSPGDLTPVFRAMLEKATTICGAKFGMLLQYQGGLFHLAASLNLPPLLADFMYQQNAFAPQPGRTFGRLIET